MPQILVVADLQEDTDSAVVYRERVSLSDLDSDYFSGQLVERVGWAMLDAEELEHDQGDQRSPG
jgi:endoglucanase Acf2